MQNPLFLVESEMDEDWARREHQNREHQDRGHRTQDTDRYKTKTSVINALTTNSWSYHGYICPDTELYCTTAVYSTVLHDENVHVLFLLFVSLTHMTSWP